MHSLSREEKKNLSFHLSLALSILFCLGLAMGVAGFIFFKEELILIGGIVAAVPVLYLMISSYLEQKRINNKLRSPILTELSQIKIAQQQAETFLNSFHLDGSIDLCLASKKDAINHLSLERLTETLKERLEQVEKLIYSNNTEKIIEGVELFESPLRFPAKNTEVLMGHEMPDMNKSSWIDSLKFLKKELENIQIY